MERFRFKKPRNLQAKIQVLLKCKATEEEWQKECRRQKMCASCIKCSHCLIIIPR